MGTQGYERPMLATAQAADYCGLSASTLNKGRVYGDGPSFLKLGRRVVYHPEDLDAWLIARRRTSTSDHGEAA